MPIDPALNLPTLPETTETAEQLLEGGNYAYAFHLAVEPEIKAAARILCGAIDSGFAELAELDTLSDQAKLFQAYGLWCSGEDEAALSVLDGLDSDASDQLAKLISEGANVLLYTMPHAEGIESFDNIKIGHEIIAPENFGTSTIKSYPGLDLILSLGAFGAYLPSDVFEQDCPTVFWVGDHDFFYATREQDMARASVLIANSAAEHLELAAHYETRVASFPGHETYGRSDDYPAPSDQKAYDIGYTGRAFVPYMPDKAQFLYRLATLNDPDLNISIQDGYLEEDDFVEVRRQSKYVPLFWRYAGGLQTRAIDALRQRSFVLSPEKMTTAELLGGDEAGIVSINSETPENEALNQINTYTERRRSYVSEADHFGDQFTDLFWPRPALDQRLIKFCLFQSLLDEQPKASRVQTQVLPAELRGYSPEDAIEVYTAIAKFNLAQEQKTVAHYNFAAGAAFYGATMGAGNEKLGQFAIDTYGLGQAAFPENMVLKFNAARALWTFGAKPEASVLFGELARSSEPLQYDPKDALLSHRLQPLSEMFPYGAYFRAALKEPAAAQAMIQSAGLTYLGVLAFETDQMQEGRAFFEKAVALSSINFPAFRYLTQVLAQLGAEPAEILAAFYQAINLYPPELSQLLPFGVRAELAEGREEDAATLLQQWVLFHLRVLQPTGEPLPLDPAAVAIVQEHRPLLDGWIGEAFDQMMQNAAH